MAMAKTEIWGIEFDTKKEALMCVSKKILDDYDESITLRQLYYRFVGYDILENKESQYDYLGEAVRDARLSGLISYDSIEDRLREPVSGDNTSIPPERLMQYRLQSVKELPEEYSRPRWEGQDRYVEVWVEKAALQRLFRNTCDPVLL